MTALPTFHKLPRPTHAVLVFHHPYSSCFGH
jgi:hypothetical protein